MLGGLSVTGEVAESDRNLRCPATASGGAKRPSAVVVEARERCGVGLASLLLAASDAGGDSAILGDFGVRGS